jgi:hypothetical protein
MLNGSQSSLAQTIQVDMGMRYTGLVAATAQATQDNLKPTPTADTSYALGTYPSLTGSPHHGGQRSRCGNVCT